MCPKSHISIQNRTLLSKIGHFFKPFSINLPYLPTPVLWHFSANSQHAFSLDWGLGSSTVWIWQDTLGILWTEAKRTKKCIHKQSISFQLPHCNWIHNVQEACCIRTWLICSPMKPLTLICRVFDRCSSRTSDIHVFFQYPIKCGLYTLSRALSFVVWSGVGGRGGWIWINILQLLTFRSFLIMIIFIEKEEEQTL